MPTRHNLTAALWLVDHRHLLPRSGTALDVACGRGRHALWLAAQGFTVQAIDRDADAVIAVNADASRLGLPVTATVANLEGDDPALGRQAFDVIVVVHYLHRPLFPSLIAALRDGGVLVYETFTRDQALRGKPTNPAFLLEPGELQRLVAPLEILATREDDINGQCVASVIARRSVGFRHAPERAPRQTPTPTPTGS